MAKKVCLTFIAGLCIMGTLLMGEEKHWSLLVRGGEFGRTPTSEGVNKPGRDHNWHGFSMCLTGAEVKGGQAISATDEFGFGAVEDKTHVSDLHATILHLMGLDHNKLTFFHLSLDQKLTGVQRVAKVVKKALA